MISRTGDSGTKREGVVSGEAPLLLDSWIRRGETTRAFVLFYL